MRLNSFRAGLTNKADAIIKIKKTERRRYDHLGKGAVMAKDYYAVLGVLPTATSDEIKSAYRSRVKQFHPDYYGKNSAPFLRIQEAYEILGNPDSRSSYDRSLKETGSESTHAGRNIPITVRPNRPTVEPLLDPRRASSLGTVFARSSFHSYFPSFDEIFDSLWNEFFHPHAKKSEHFQTMTMEVLLTRDQARRGGQIRIHIPIQHPCPVCDGLGDSGSTQCLGCDGSGWNARDFSLLVDYPPGIQDYYKVAIPLDRYGIPDICPVVLFRISSEGDFEDNF